MFEFKTSVRRLNIAQRFQAGIGFFSLPTGSLLYFDIDQATKQVELARQELAGNRFQRPAVRPLKALGDYRIASVTAWDSADMGAAKQKVDGLFRQLGGGKQGRRGKTRIFGQCAEGRRHREPGSGGD